MTAQVRAKGGNGRAPLVDARVDPAT